MSLSKLLLSLSLLAYIFSLSSSDPIQYNITYSIEYKLDMKDFPEGHIPKDTNINFVMFYNLTEQTTVTLKTLRSDKVDKFDGYVYYYDHQPSEEEVRKHTEYSYYDYLAVHSGEMTYKYVKLIYDLDSSHTGLYLVVNVINDVDLNFLSVLVSNQTPSKPGLEKEIEFDKEVALSKEELEKYKAPYFFFFNHSEHYDKEAVIIKVNEECGDDEIMLEMIGTLNYTLKPEPKDIVDIRAFYNYDSRETKDNITTYVYSYSKLKDRVKHVIISVFTDCNFDYFSFKVTNEAFALTKINLFVLFAMIVALVL